MEKNNKRRYLKIAFWVLAGSVLLGQQWYIIQQNDLIDSLRAAVGFHRGKTQECSEKYKQLSYEIFLAEEAKKAIKYYEEADALAALKDHFDFYRADMVYRNPRVRRVAPNKFEVALETCINKPEAKYNNFFWNPKVATVTIDAEGKYSISGVW